MILRYLTLLFLLSFCWGCSGRDSESIASTSNAIDSDGDGLDDSVDQCDGRLYGSKVVVGGTELAAALSTATSDLLTSLNDITSGPDFALQTSDLTGPCLSEGSTAIHIRTTSNLGSVPPAVQTLATQLTSSQSTRDSYGVYAASGAGLWIIAPRASGLRHGIYEYLKFLGVRWLLPNPAWKITPTATSDVRWNTWPNSVRAPVVRALWPIAIGKQRDGAGAGFPPTLPSALDVDDKGEWKKWRDRNRFPGEFTVSGPVVNSAASIAPVFCANNRFLSVYHWDQGHQSFSPTDCATTPIPPHIGINVKWHYTFTGACSGGVCDEGQDPTCASAGAPGCDYTSFGGLTKRLAEFEYLDLKYSMDNSPGADAPETQYVNLKQGDGGGHCDCEKCRNLLKYGPYFPPGTYTTVSRASDRVFHIANRVGEYVEQQAQLQGYGSRGVSIVAHFDAADAPTIPLRKNLLVLTQPYIYSADYVWKTPKEIEDAWSAKRLNNPDGHFVLGVYDTWVPAPSQLSPGQATHTQWDIPQMSLDEATVRTQRWIEKFFQHLQFETTYSAAALGPHYLMVAAKAWGEDGTVAVNDLFSKGFGPAETRVRGMFNRWWQRFDLTPHELGLSFADMQAAVPLVKVPGDGGTCQLSTATCNAHRARLDDIRAYVHYLRLYYEYDEAFKKCGTNYSAFELASDKLIEHLWRIYPRNVVFSNQLYLVAYDRLKLNYNVNCPTSQSTTYLNKWNRDTGTAWSSLTPVTSSELDGLMTQGAAAYPLPVVPNLTFGANLVPLLATAPPCGGGGQPPCTPVSTMAYDGRKPQTFAFAMRTAGNPQLEIQVRNVRLNSPPTFYPEVYKDAGIAPVKVTIRDSAGAVAYSTSISLPVNTLPTEPAPTTHGLGPMSLQTGTYTLEVWAFDSQTHFSIKAPFGLPFAQIAPQYIPHNYDVSRHWYFYVPFGTTRFALAYDVSSGTGTNMLKFFYPPPTYGQPGTEIGSPAVVRNGSVLYEVQVPPGGDGKVWSMTGQWGAHLEITPRFINIPTVFSFSLEQMLIPNDACAEVTALDMPSAYGTPLQNIGNARCLRIRQATPSPSGYPSGFVAGEWVNLVKDSTQSGGEYPTPFVWRNTCTGASGRATLTSDPETPHPLGPLDPNCSTLIKLQGSGAGFNSIVYWPWGCTASNSTVLPLFTPHAVANTNLHCLKIDDYSLIKDTANLLSASGTGQYGQTPLSLPFEWANLCGDANSGHGTLTNDYSAPHVMGPLDQSCPTIIRLRGAYAQPGTVKLEPGLCVGTPTVDLTGFGSVHQPSTNGCARINSYPIQNGEWVNLVTSVVYAGQYPTPFVWWNTCGAVGGQGTLTNDYNAPHPLGPLNTSCPTMIRLLGNGGSTSTVTYWPWACTPSSSQLLSCNTAHTATEAWLYCMKIDNTTLSGNFANFLTATGPGDYPMAFEWANPCGLGASGSGTLTSSSQHTLGTLSTACPTFIRLRPATTGKTATVKYDNCPP